MSKKIKAVKRRAMIDAFLDDIRRAGSEHGPIADSITMKRAGFRLIRLPDGTVAYKGDIEDGAESTIYLEAGRVEAIQTHRSDSIELYGVSGGIARRFLHAPPEAQVVPPRLAEYTFYLIIRDKNARSVILGDLEEQYQDVYSKFGRRMASVFYWEQVMLSLGPLIWKTLTKIVQIRHWFAR